MVALFTAAAQRKWPVRGSSMQAAASSSSVRGILRLQRGGVISESGHTLAFSLQPKRPFEDWFSRRSKRVRSALRGTQALGSRGAHVVVSSRRQANVDKAVALLRSQDIQVTGTTCNVGKGEDREKLIQTALDRCGGIDILVSNAAVNPFFGNTLDSTEEVWDKRGKYHICVICGGVPTDAGTWPLLREKTALLGLTKVLAPELAQSNIRVNCVAPGVIKTRFSAALWENEAIVDELKKQLSIKRIGQVEEIGGVVAFLCSEEASYITGETIT
ncbi:unnamed protein product, partial [Tetraodon nigroviridis]